MLFLVVLGGAALLEVHRAKNGAREVKEVKLSEKDVVRQLEVRASSGSEGAGRARWLHGPTRWLAIGRGRTWGPSSAGSLGSPTGADRHVTAFSCDHLDLV